MPRPQLRPRHPPSPPLPRRRPRHPPSPPLPTPRLRHPPSPPRPRQPVELLMLASQPPPPRDCPRRCWAPLPPPPPPNVTTSISTTLTGTGTMTSTPAIGTWSLKTPSWPGLRSAGWRWACCLVSRYAGGAGTGSRGTGRYGNFDVVLGRVSRPCLVRLYAATDAPFHARCEAHMLTGCLQSDGMLDSRLFAWAGFRAGWATAAGR